MTDYLLPLLVFSTIFERFNFFLPGLGFSLKLSLILLPVVGLVLLWKRKLAFNPTFLFPFLVLILLVEGLSILFSYDPAQSFQVLVFHGLMIGLFYLIVWSIQDAGSLARLVYAWRAGAVAISLLGIWQFVQFLLSRDPTLFLDRLLSAKTLAADTFIQQIAGVTFLRPSSTFLDVNTAASFVGIAILLVGSQLSVVSGKKVKVFLLLSMAVSFIYFILAFSRSATFGLAVGAVVLGFLLLRSRILKGGLVLLLAVLISGLIYFSLFDPARLESSLARLEYAKAAASMFASNPLLGVGAGNFEPYYTNVLKPEEQYGYSHSIFLTWVGELGILGVLANLVLILMIISFLWRTLKSLPRDSLWYVRLSGVLAAFVALVSANLFHAHYGLEFTWVLLGLVVGGLYLAKQGISDKQKAKRIDFLGVGVDNVMMQEAVEKVKEFFKIGRKAYVTTPNPEMVVAAQKDSEFAKILNESDLAIPDGVGLVWASRIWGTPLKERVSGTDFFLELCAEAARRGGRVFLLGGRAGVAEETAEELRRRFPKLKIAGTFAGDGSPEGDGETVRRINQSPNQPIDFLFVAYGHGKQERWLVRNLEKVPVKVAMGVGGAFDYIAGEVLRAPAPFRRLGLEWFYRLVKQPWRWRRQLALLPFIALVFRESFRR